MSDFFRFTPIPTESWMEHLLYNSKQFKNKTLLEISLPGSHDAATYTMADSVMARFAVTQQKTLKEQFELGVRYFDIRMHRTRAAKKGKETELQFFHGAIDSAKEAVFPNMMNFLSAIVASKEIVILKLHFSSPKDFELFDQLYISEEIRQMIVSPNDFKVITVDKLIKSNKRIVLLTNKGGPESDIHSDYKENSFGGWAKTRNPEDLLKKMNGVRSTMQLEMIPKLRIVQTNQPALVGGGGNRFASVLTQDELPASRTVTEQFLKESREILVTAIMSHDTNAIQRVRQAVHGVISMDNIGSDRRKDYAVLKVIEMNLDDEDLLSSLDGLASHGVEMKEMT